MPGENTSIIPHEAIQSKILILRGKKVMLDRDLAMLYGVETRILIQAVKRNVERFPEDFMFQLVEQEFKNLISQIVIPSWGGTRKLPYAFTENGVAMLSSVLRSKKAININIQIIRAFIKMREMFEDLRKSRGMIEKMKTDYDNRFNIYHRIIEAHCKDIKTIYKLLSSPEGSQKDEIGFRVKQKNKR